VRILVDSNIIISAALFPEGKVSKVFSYILETHTVVIASYSINECKTVFMNKFPDKTDYFSKFLHTIDYEPFKTPKNLNPDDFPAIRGAGDLPILASAILADVDILLTGDKDFEEIAVKKPLIFTPNQYFELIQK
jgi:predicted nucleic acid-binding protein